MDDKRDVVLIVAIYCIVVILTICFVEYLQINQEQFSDSTTNDINDINSFSNEFMGDGTNNEDNSNIDHKIQDLNNKLVVLTNEFEKLYKSDIKGDYIIHGWFVQFFDIIDHPNGVMLAGSLNKVQGIPVICFRTRDSFPFLGYPEKPLFFPKQENSGFRAMTILKVPKTGYYDFKILTDDGMRVYYQKTTSNVIYNEKNVRTPWTLLIDGWQDQAETWFTSKKLYFNQNDLVLVRVDYYQHGGYASACVKLRYYENNKIDENDLPYNNTYCSLLWQEVPILGVS